ncbi:MAG: hypothetical protein FWH38_06530, partial [Treponema sp.]|nr:hypothetical protein [Treponema sp.]
MKKAGFSLAALAMLALAACTSTNYSANMTGASDYSTVAVKDFTTLGIVTVRATEVHYSGPLGFQKGVEGSKITFSDLMQEAARLEADDIINVRIDMNSNYVKGAFDWLTGWTRTYTYTGTALAIKYTGKMDADIPDPQLGGLPKAPEATGAVRTTRSGRV